MPNRYSHGKKKKKRDPPFLTPPFAALDPKIEFSALSRVARRERRQARAGVVVVVGGYRGRGLAEEGGVL